MLGIAPGARLNGGKTCDHDLDLLRALGVPAFRWYPRWSGIEREMGVGDFDWTETDKVLGGAAARGMQVLVGVSSRGDGHLYDAEHIDAIGPYASALVDRYSSLTIAPGEHAVPNLDDVEGVMLGIEGVNEGFFEKVDPQPTAGRYLACQRAIYEAVKLVNPTILVGTGGIIGSAQHLVDLYAAHESEDDVPVPWDFVCWHTYTTPVSAQTSRRTHRGGWWSCLEARRVMVEHGDAHKQIWITETGWNTGGRDAVSEMLQAEYIEDAVRRFRRHSWAGPMFIFTGWDTRVDPSNDRGDYMGLVRADDSEKPAASVFRGLAAIA